MSVLDKIGIQQWRRRRSAADIQANPVVQNSLIAKNASALAGQASVSKVAASQASVSQVAASQASSATVKDSPSKPTLEPRIWPKKPVDDQSNTLPTKQSRVGVLPKETDKKARNTRPLQSVVPKPMPAPLPALDTAPLVKPVTGIMFDNENSNSPSLEQHRLEKSGDELPQNELNKPVAADNLADLNWRDLQNLVNGWRHCPSCGEGKSLLGYGDVNADWLFISDAPSSAEVEQGRLFAGRSGQLFEAMLGALGLQRDSVYSTSLFKCVASDDISIIPACDTILLRQIQLLQPKVIVTFGEFTAKAMLKSNANLEELRSQTQQCLNSKTALIPTFTPAQMLDDANLKSKVWADLKKAIAIVKQAE